MDVNSIKQTLGTLPDHLDDIFYFEYTFPGDHMHVMLWPSDEGVETAAQAFAETCANCSEDRHNGHGRTHDSEDVDDAYRAAILQGLTRNVDGEYQELLQKMRAAAKWGGPVPKAVLTPNTDNPTGKWDLLVTDDEGEPWFHKIRDGVLDDVMPDPRTIDANPSDIGWKIAKPGG